MFSSLYRRRMYKKWKRWGYKNTFLLVVVIFIVVWLASTPILDATITHIGNLGYIGAFLVGVLSVSTFTIVPASIVLFHLADYLHPLEVAVLAGFGSMIGDYVIFRFTRDKVLEELAPLVHHIETPTMKVLYKSPYFANFLVVVGALLIASPLPDDIGVSLMGASKINSKLFLLLSFVLNAVGIFIIVYAATLIK